MFKNKKVVIFDLDGTLIDSMGIWNRADESLIKKFTNKTVEEFFNDNNINAKDIGQLRDRLLAEFKSEDIYVQYCAWLKERFNTNMPAEEILKVRWDFANELLQKEVDYKEDADVLLKKLKQNGYTLALATTTPKARLDLYRKKLKKVNIDEIFSIILTKEDVIHKKPDPEIYKKIIEKLDIKPEEVVVGSTGVIGQQLPMDVIKEGIKKLVPELKADRQSEEDASWAILTTDTKPKEAAVEVEIAGKTVTIAGMCKGSGMIHPNMGTMLGFITTDAAIDKALLLELQRELIEDTFNMVSVDGDTSTNDTVLLLSNGLANNRTIMVMDEDYYKFVEALHEVNVYLSKKIAGDGEGATALFEVKVINGESKEQAVTLAKSIVTSSLTKAAIYGHDANWGRILCAMGYSNAKFNPDIVDIYFESKAGKIKIVENGMATDYSEEVATKILSENEVTAIADVKMGEYEATAWGCDLTHEYVSINADYRS